jgi:leader peptidase (prepilin peptidase)/N-methyltransferase
MSELFAVLGDSSALFIFLMSLVGLLVGSFLNVVIYRLPKMLEQEWQLQCDLLSGQTSKAITPLSLSKPRSTCPHCGHPISALENIPVLSYLLLRGKCRSCHAPISIRYPLIELLSALLTAVIAWQFGLSWACLGGVLLTWTLIALTFIDVDCQLLPDKLTLPLLWLGIAFNLFANFASLNDSVIGAMLGYLSLWSVYQLFRLITGKEGMGYGDFKLLAALGAWMGWQSLPVIILLSSLVGAIVGISLIALKLQQHDKPIPFGPYLAAAGWIALVWGDTLNQSYLSWSGLGG